MNECASPLFHSFLSLYRLFNNGRACAYPVGVFSKFSMHKNSKAGMIPNSRSLSLSKEARPLNNGPQSPLVFFVFSALSFSLLLKNGLE